MSKRWGANVRAHEQYVESIPWWLRTRMEVEYKRHDKIRIIDRTLVEIDKFNLVPYDISTTKRIRNDLK